MPIREPAAREVAKTLLSPWSSSAGIATDSPEFAQAVQAATALIVYGVLEDEARAVMTRATTQTDCGPT